MKKVVIGITGSVAIYKTCEIISHSAFVYFVLFLKHQPT